MCDYISDLNNTFSHSLLKETVWSAEYYTDGRRKVSSYFKIARNLMSNIIIVRLKYKSSEIEMNKLDVRTTTTDKIANFGGTFGIWAELTGCSLLGFINLITISFKLLLTIITRFFWFYSLVYSFLSLKDSLDVNSTVLIRIKFLLLNYW